MSKNPNEEIFIDGDESLRFVADFGVMNALGDIGHDVNRLFSILSNGDMPVREIKDILVCSISDIDEHKKESVVIDLINRHGLQEASIIAQMMLSHGLLGSVKKSMLARRELVRGILDLFHPSPSTSLKRVGLLWGVMCVISTALACLISRLLEAPI